MRTLALITLLLTAGCDVAPGPPAEPSPAETTSKEPPPMSSSISRSGHDLRPLTPDVKSALVAQLDPETVEITQRAGTEPAHCGTLLDNQRDGMYACVVCGLPLFSSEHKFKSGSGWPSFFTAYDEQHVARIEDHSHGMIRTEIACARCDAHLGHVFADGPKPTGERHCLNSAALTFIEEGAPVPEASKPMQTETAYFAGGCFWGIEHYMQQGPGVIDAVSGYMQGDDTATDYHSVCSGETGHAESVMVVFDPSEVSFRTLVDAFLRMHDPTEVNRQGPDIGTQYRSGIWTTSDEQAATAQEAIEAVNASGKHPTPVATEVAPAKTFHPAETYHQDYVARTGRACHVVNPWPIEEAAAPDH